MLEISHPFSDLKHFELLHRTCGRKMSSPSRKPHHAAGVGLRRRTRVNKRPTRSKVPGKPGSRRLPVSASHLLRPTNLPQDTEYDWFGCRASDRYIVDMLGGKTLLFACVCISGIDRFQLRYNYSSPVGTFPIQSDRSCRGFMGKKAEHYLELPGRRLRATWLAHRYISI